MHPLPPRHRLARRRHVPGCSRHAGLPTDPGELRAAGQHGTAQHSSWVAGQESQVAGRQPLSGGGPMRLCWWKSMGNTAQVDPEAPCCSACSTKGRAARHSKTRWPAQRDMSMYSVSRWEAGRHAAAWASRCQTSSQGPGPDLPSRSPLLARPPTALPMATPTE